MLKKKNLFRQHHGLLKKAPQQHKPARRGSLVFRSDVVGDRGSMGTAMEAQHLCLNGAVRFSDALVLTEMVEPARREELLAKTPRPTAVLEDSPHRDVNVCATRELRVGYA